MVDIAIIGISHRFPSSSNYQQFWQHLIESQDVRSFFPAERLKLILHSKKEIWDKYRTYFENNQTGLHTTPGYYLKNIEFFDPDFFQIPPAEATVIDPRHRLFLMLVWEALQDAGYKRQTIQNTETGIFLGFAPRWEGEYTRFFSQEEPTQIEGNNTAACAARPSYWLNLTGPVITVNTTCSSSLVACHLGVRSLIQKECSVAIVGGIQCDIFPYWDEEPDIGIESVDHCCKTFDASADGTAFGDGMAVVVLKRLEDALAAKDPIHAIIKGSAVNSDGRSNGLSAPNPKAQVSLIQKALKQAHLLPDDVGYFEAHGTGTKLGDPIEIEALSKVLEKNTHRPYVGSVKPNIGHLGDAAGLAGMIKAILCLKNKKIPQQMHFKKMNPLIQYAGQRLVIPTKNQNWELKEGQERRRAGVSSFGVTGTNAHIILEEWPLEEGTTSLVNLKNPLPLSLSGPTPASLWLYLQQIKEFLDIHPDTPLCDLCYTSNFFRECFPHRICIWAEDLFSLKNKIEQLCEWREFEEFPPRFFHQGIWTSIHPWTQMDVIFPGKMSKGKEYIEGKEVDFSTFYEGISPRRIFMPYPPLDMGRYWPTSGNIADDNINDLFYDFAWEEKEPAEPTETAPSICLIFAHPTPFTENLSKKLAQYNKEVVLVSPGTEFKNLSHGHWVIRAKEPDDYQKLIEQVKGQSKRHLKEIVHLWTYLPPETDALNPAESEKIKELGIFSLFHISRALIKYPSTEDIRLNLVSSYGKLVHESENIQPLRAMAYGFIRVLSQEHPWLSTFGIDLEFKPEDSSYAEILAQEIMLPREKRSLLAAMRNRKIYAEVITPKHIPKSPSSPIISEGEVIVLVGGSGYLGKLLISYLSERAKAHFVVLSRTPPESKFIEEVISKGSHLIHFRTDVYSEQDIKNSMKLIQRDFQTIDTVFILTKDLAHQLIKDISFEEFANKISGRVDAFHFIQKYAKPLSPKRWVIFSSVSSILGGKTACECCSVNQFFDSIAYYKNHTQSIHTQVINLTLIDDDRNLNLGLTPIPAILPEEFLKGLFHFLRSHQRFSILSRFNFEDIEYLKPVIKLQFSKEVEANQPTKKTASKPQKYSKEHLELQLIGIWRKVLGYEEIDSEANFFEIGGTSLSALKLTKLIRENLGIESSVTDLFQNPRLNSLCDYYFLKYHPEDTVEEKRTGRSNLKNLIQMVSNQEMSIDEALEELSWTPE